MDALTLGLSIGLAAGISPGPLLALVIASALRSGWRAGTLAAVAPLITDVFVVTAALLMLGHVPQRAVAVIGVLGSAFVIWMGVRTVLDARTASLAPAEPDAAVPSLVIVRRAVIVNLLSPHPWVTWTTALGPMVVQTWRDRHSGAVAFVVGFYLTLVGAKIAVAALVAGGRRRLRDSGYRRALTVAGALLVLAGLALAVEFAPGLG